VSAVAVEASPPADSASATTLLSGKAYGTKDSSVVGINRLESTQHHLLELLDAGVEFPTRGSWYFPSNVAVIANPLFGKFSASHATSLTPALHIGCRVLKL
jgi:hypothetical protein